MYVILIISLSSIWGRAQLVIMNNNIFICDTSQTEGGTQLVRFILFQYWSRFVIWGDELEWKSTKKRQEPSQLHLKELTSSCRENRRFGQKVDFVVLHAPDHLMVLNVSRVSKKRFLRFSCRALRSNATVSSSDSCRPERITDQWLAKSFSYEVSIYDTDRSHRYLFTRLV